MAPADPRPILEQTAFERAVEVETHRNGKVVATHKKYSDGLLKYMLERGEKRGKLKSWEKPQPSVEQMRDEVLRRLNAIEASYTDEEREAAIEHIRSLPRRES